MPELFFIGSGGDGWSWVMWILFMAFLIFFYPRLMLSQILYKLERSAEEFELMTKKSKKFIISRVAKKPSKQLEQSIDRFFEFFVVSPVSLDPYGIVRKFEHIMQEQKKRFSYFVKQTAPHLDSERQANIVMGLAGGISMNEIAKIVRHYVELIRKTKSLQIAMVLQMQMPLIERIAKAVYRGTRALTDGQPIGDGLGPLVIAELAGNVKMKEIEEDVLMARKKIKKRDVFLLKAKGVGGRLGRPGKAIDKLVRRYKIDKIITVDAAAKLEGEKTGSLAEGVGVAMGGVGVEKSYIENVAVKNDIPLDGIVVKMASEEAITPMRKAIKDAVPEAVESIKRSLETVRPKGKVIIAGIGNTSGVGNNKKSAEEVKKWVEKYEKRLKAKRKKKRSVFW
jgi:hypothetical protein